MPAEDSIKPAVVAALQKDGWTITHDPYTISFGGITIRPDLAAERLIAAERGTDRIAVEIKSFISPSPVHDFEEALGQFLLYLSIISRVDPGRKLYLAIDRETDETLFQRDAIRATLEDYSIARVVVQTEEEVIASWIG